VNQWMARRVIREADRVVTVSRPITEEMIHRSGRKKEGFSTLYNGYDKTDFHGIRFVSTEKFTITYCGTLSPVLNPKVFLEGVEKAIRIQPDLKQKLSIRFVGSVIRIKLDEMIHRCRLEEVVDIVGYVPHGESIQYLMSSDMLFLLLSKDLGKGMVTGKIFEYLASGKPILAAVPRGEAERLVLKHARGVVLLPDDREGTAAQIVRSFTLWKRGDLRLTVPRWKGIHRFERRTQTGELVKMFESVVSEKSGINFLRVMQLGK